jgi:anti-anti-sigma regulatory factor
MKKNDHKISIQVSRKTLIVPIQYELNEQIIANLKIDLFAAIAQYPVKAVIFDMKGIQLIDDVDLSELIKLARMVNFVGLRTVICGLLPGVVATIVLLDINWEDLQIAFDLDDAYKILKKPQKK